MKRPLTRSALGALLAALTALAPLGAQAAPPNPTLPTGACAGIVKDSEGAHVSFYLDFDNRATYATAVARSTENGVQESRSLIIADGTPLTMGLSNSVPYAITGAFNATDPETGATARTEARLIPVNGGTTFLVEVLDEIPLTGICQKI